MRALLSFLPLWRRHALRLLLGILLAILTLLASIGLLSLSGWFLAGASLAGFAGLYSFNYMLPAAGVRGAAIVRTASRYFERLVSHDGTFRVLQHLRVWVFSHLLPLSPGGLSRFRQGDLLNRLVADVDTLDHLYLRVISPLVGALVTIVVVTVGLTFLDVSLALTLGGLLLLTLLVLPPLFWWLGRPSGAAIAHLRSQYRLLLTRFLQGQAELTLYGARDAARAQLDSTEADWQRAQQRQADLTGLSQALLIAVTGLTVTLLLWLSAGGIGDLPTPGAFLALVVFCALAAFEALAPVAGAFQHLGRVSASAERLQAMITTPPAVQFPPTVSSSPVRDGGVALEAVSFHYPDQPVPALQDITLRLPAGAQVAIVGRTGCGKSTLLQLLTRAWDPDSGSITVGGIPLPAWDEASLRASTSVVSQRVTLFSATLRDNLLLAAPHADDATLAAALERVGLGRLLSGEEGLNAWLGEGGRMLSGGELRRLSIARALLHGGELLLLDEPTEGLDAETERQILDVLEEVSRGKTRIMVTHRLQRLDRLDRLFVLDEGRLLEQGSHDELVAKRGRYWTFLQQSAL
ncbi:cysteine/glutathione ABC transporter ATP-binding protein/permease CydC [Pantoea sp. 1.19]|uniref:heme ABC transporter ATP-binding protein/permease CydC n=1 Tax=Pantoea sp. 1.19 TaxID=1925589 RepID=UPI000948DC47|nr:cysteine/glutathione ABC transporter ATP-binding protein/permease CydC [Pantoea sp. 1.19]